MKTILTSMLLGVIALTARAQTLTTDAFEQQLKQTPKAQLIDVRTSGEYGGGHLQGATNIDYRDPAFAQKLTGLDKAQPVYVYCLSGGRSAEAARLMREQGFSNVYELQGGYLKWTTRLKPVEGAKSDALAKAITPADLQQTAGTNRLVLVDFYAPWCAPCQKMMPTIDRLKTEYAGKMAVVKADADASKALMQAYQVDEIPTLLFLKDGKVSQRLVGLQTPEHLTELVESQLTN